MAGGLAITGYACRLPGARNAAAFWNLLDAGQSAISSIGPDRFNTARFLSAETGELGKTYTLAAGLLDDVWGFDPGFFGLSRREALQMDPQQRVLLQVVWEAIEHAGLRPGLMDRARTGVYVGASSSDHSMMFLGDPARVDQAFMLGNTLSIMSNRISYLLDLTGPSYTVDTACSSSFFALDQARRALETEEIDTAIVGAVNVLMSPLPFVGFSRAGMLSPEGRCKAFDANANGYVRSEGAVVFVLRRRQVADVEGDLVRGQLIATGVNSDGRTTGMAMPSVDGQSKLLRNTLDASGIDPNDLAFMEAHGTGTQVGDFVEASAIGTIYGQKRKTALPIGSAKTNVGHLEPVSGLVGLLKAQLSLEHGRLPRSLHLETPNPAIDFEGLKLDVATQSRDIPRRRKPWMAAINSFGFGGANAHAIIAEAALPKRRPKSVRADTPLILSAANEAALGDLGKSWISLLEQSEPAEAARLINMAAHRRERMTHCLVATGQSPAEIASALRAHEDGRGRDSFVAKRVAAGKKTAFVFAGNGSQWAGMALAQMESDESFRQGFEKVARLFETDGGPDLSSLLNDPELASKLERSTVAQPLLFAVQVAITEALAARGVHPDAVAGHSVGEVAAAWSAGALTLADAVHLIRSRSQALEALYQTGGMAAVLSGVGSLEEALEAFGDSKITLAAENNPRSCTISGPVEELRAFAAFARKRRVAVKILDIPYAYHSAAVEPLKAELLAEIADMKPRDCETLFVSAATGSALVGSALDPEFWWLNTRAPVQFRQAVASLVGAGCGCFIEIGPRPVLENYVLESATDAGATVQFMPTLENGRRSALSIDHVAARAVAMGAQTDETKYFGPAVPYAGGLPTYPWQNAPHQAEATSDNIDHYGTDVSSGAGHHPLLGWRLRKDEPIWHVHLSKTLLPWLADHAVDGTAVFPAAGLAEIALAAGRISLGARAETDGLELTGLDILQPLLVEQTVDVRTSFEHETGTVRIESRPYLGTADWMLVARGRVRLLPSANSAPAEVREQGEVLDIYALYQSLTAAGLHYGQSFRRVASGTISGDVAYLTLSPEEVGSEHFALDPTALDGAMHGIFALIADAAARHEGMAERKMFLPTRVGQLRLMSPGRQVRSAEVRLKRSSTRALSAALVLRDRDGAAVAELSELRLKAVPSGSNEATKPRFWRQRLVRLSDGPDGAHLPDAWSAPMTRLVALRVASEQPPSISASGLLIDAASRRVTWDAVQSLAGPGRQLGAQAIAAVHQDAKPLLGRLLMALEEDGLFARGKQPENATGLEGELAEQCDYPSFDVLLSGLSQEAPERATDLLSLATLAEALPALLRQGPSERPAYRSIPECTISLRAQWDAVRTSLEDISSAWPADKRLSILVVGSPPAGLVQALLGNATVATLAIADPDDGVTDLLRQTLPKHPSLTIAKLDELTRPERFDVAVTVDGFCRLRDAALSAVADSLSSNGLLLGVQPVPDLYQDLCEGQQANWWSDTLSADMPIGRRQSTSELLERLARCGFEQAERAYLNSSDVETLCVTARSLRAAQSLTETPMAREEAPPTTVLFHGRRADDQSVATSLQSALSNVGRTTRLAELSPVLSIPEEPWEGIYLMRGHETDAEGADTTETLARSIAELRQVLTRLPDPVRLWLLLPQGCPAADNPQGAGTYGSGLWALGRVLMNERPDLDVRMIDPRDALHRADGLQQLAELITNPSDQREIVIDGAGIEAPRIEPISTPRTSESGTARRLVIGRQGALEQLVWEGADRRAPEAGEVEIAVRATGLNFRDVMWAQGLLPEEALEDGFAGTTLGMECAGVVVRAGTESGFSEGDRAVAFAPGCFASHVTVTADTVARLPRELDFDKAAALPTIFATAQYGLVDLAGLQAGETVLIHGGAGGVGLAALQIARRIGARVIATAGTPAKRRLLETLGADAVFNSRDLAFVSSVLSATAGDGVDVVLNSLAGEAMERSIECLRPFGRFVELGKRDFYSDTRIGLRPFRQNLSYFGVDLDQLLAARPAHARRLFTELMEGFADGSFVPPPCQVFEASDVRAAFRLMQQSGHLGKIVVRGQAPSSVQRTTKHPKVEMRDAWLVVGGLKGFGLATAEWLATQGVSKLWLISQSGKASDADAARIGSLLTRGVAVETAAIDIADANAVAELMNRISQDRAPLRGVVHSAMVLRDKPFQDLSDDDIRAVLAPKLRGAELLDQATRAMELDHFILYSSAVTLFGNAYQAPYVAANQMLERIAAERVAAGLPGLAIGWGGIGDAGYLTRDERAHQMLSRSLDGAMLTASDALEALGTWIASGETLPAVSYAALPWARLAEDLPIISTPLFERLGDARKSMRSGAERTNLRAMLAEMDTREALKTVTEILVGETALVLYQSAAEIDPRRPLSEIGFDSLMAVDLRMSIEEKFGLSLPLLSLADATTLSDVAVKVLQIARDGEKLSDADAVLENLIAQHAGEEHDLDSSVRTEIRNRAEAGAGLT